jgi:predicted MPP superfamily phosphohydrolase
MIDMAETLTLTDREDDAHMELDLMQRLQERLGPVYARQRLGIEEESVPRVFGRGFNFFHPENWYSSHALIRYALKLSGLYWRGRRNILDFRVSHNELSLAQLPVVFDGLRLLHLSDLHLDMYEPLTEALVEKISRLDYDLCVLTGDYRAWTFGPIDRAMAAMRSLCMELKKPVFGVLGNHDSVRMVPELEDMGIRMLLNESVPIEREGEAIYLAGIDDAHYFRVDNIEKAAHAIPHGAVSLLLSHTPEIYLQAAHAGFDVFLCGHTHGGQICLPGGIPLTLDSRCPRDLGAGDWQHNQMQGYTSVGAGASIVEVRLNCPPEITLHTLRRASPLQCR